MLLRDLLVALPGLIGSTNSTSRVEEVPSSSQVVSPVVVAAESETGAEPTTGTPSVLYEKAAEEPAQEPDPEAPVEPEPVEEPQEEPIEEPVKVPEEEPAEEPDPSSLLPLRTDSLSAEAGRVLTIETEGSSEVAGVRILTQASNGHVSVNPDNSLSLVLSENPKDHNDTVFRYEITYADGRTQEVEANVDVKAGQQAAGWSLGQVYMLERDADGQAVVEHGENHRKVHVTEGVHGLTADEIAKTEGLQAKDITADWLAEHPEYGTTADKALSTDLGMKLWYKITAGAAGPNSHWLLFERGYQYDDTDRLITRASMGESALNPMYIGAYGEGVDPKITDDVELYQNDSNHVVLQGLDITTFMALEGNNILLDRISSSGESGLNVQGVNGFTMINSDITDVVRQDPVNGGEIWDAGPNRINGAYIENVIGLLIEDNLVDRNGWAEGYDFNLSTKYPQPPSKFSQNLYLQANNVDITLRDNISMRAASFGAQVRPGGLIEGNIFLDNNAAVNALGSSNSKGELLGHYTLMLDNLVTSGGHKRVVSSEGALTMGIDGGGSAQSSYIGNIVAHRADPNNPAEIAQKTVTHTALNLGKDPSFDDTIIYNWSKAGDTTSPDADRNIEGLSQTTLNQTTIQNFTAELLGKETATISDLANHLRAQAAGKLDHVVDADIINAFFRKGFGLDTTLRAEAETLRFVPDDRGDGIRWDNRLNWSTGDLPGTQNGDSINLGGNRVLFGAETVTIDDFIFGDFGQLKATSGKLTISGDLATSEAGNLLRIDNAGQVWADGYRDSDLLTIELAGGRFANTGSFAGGTRIGVAEDAQLLLATAGGRFDLVSGSSLTITGSKAKVGFDGGDGQTATLQLQDDADLSFAADTAGFGKLSEFHSGAFETSDVTSGVRLDGDLAIDLSALDRNAGGTWTLVDVDQIIGSFDEIAFTGLGESRDALIRVDYVKDEVVLLVSEAGKGSGQIRAVTTGEADFIEYTENASLKSLWDSLHAATPHVTDDPI